MLLLIVGVFIGLGSSLSLCGQAPPPQTATILPLDRLNSELMEFSPAFFGQDLVYVARRRNGRVDQRGQIFYELMRAEMTEQSEVRRTKPFSIGLNSAYHEGPVSFSQDGREVFFTRSNTRHGLSRANDRGQVGLKVYRAFQGQYDWQGIEELPFNSDQYSCMHPSLSADGNRLFFASNKPGGYGGLDIYVSDYLNGAWTQAVNLGPKINTSGDEAFPFIHSSGQLFFASNGHPGQGGLDIFSIDLSGPGWGQVYNLAPPFNSEQDDLGLVLNAEASVGYLSSNRAGGSGQDDIYRVDVPAGIPGIARKPTTRELVTVYDASQSLRLYQAEVQLYAIEKEDAQNGTGYTYDLEEIEPSVYRITSRSKPPFRLGDARQFTDRDGTSQLLLSEGQSYQLVVYRDGFEPGLLQFDYTALGPSRPLEISLQASECILLEGRIEIGQTSNGISDARVRLESTNCSIPPIELRTDQSGWYQVCLPRSCQFKIHVKAVGYADQQSQFNTTATRMERLRADLQLVARQGEDHGIMAEGAVFILDQIDWEQLQQGSSDRITLLRQFLQDYPHSNVQLNVHVDTRGQLMLNQDRSEEFAQLTKDYLEANGIATERMSVVALGEQNPRNPCMDEQNCTESDHAANNRIEVHILKK
ncbi:MAG: hypothetical protein AAGF87_08040 [Bacteroidota bacterium]